MKYLLLVITVLLSGIFIVIPNSYGLIPSHNPNTDYNDQKLSQQNHLWQIGKNLSVGDSYTYKICDPGTIQTSAANYHYFIQGNDDHNSSVCYMIKLDFVNLLNSDENYINSDVWVVQAAINDYTAGRENIRYSVFHVDTLTFEVSSADTIHPDTIKYTDSLQKTLFSLFKYTAPEPQLLQIGQGWGEVIEALQSRGENPYMTVLDNNQEFSVTQNQIRMIDKQNIPIIRDITDAFQVGYEIDIFDPFILSSDKKKIIEEDDTNNVTSSFLMSANLPFPLSAEYYNPAYVTQPQKQFEFELISFMTNNKNIEFEKSTLDDLSEEDNIDLPITKIGTIGLTFTDDEIKIILEDDIMIDDIPEEDNKELPEDDTKIIPDDDVEIILNDVTIVNNDKVNYSKIAGLVVLLSVMIAGFVIFKKFRESGFKNTLKQKMEQPQSIEKKIISFDDKLHIDILRTSNRMSNLNEP